MITAMMARGGGCWVSPSLRLSKKKKRAEASNHCRSLSGFIRKHIPEFFDVLFTYLKEHVQGVPLDC